MPDSRKNDDLWAQLLGAAKAEAARQSEETKPDAGRKTPARDDPWAQLTAAAKAAAEDLTGGTEADPAGTVPEGAAAFPAGSFSGSFEKGALLMNTYRIESEPMHGGMGSVWRVHHTGWNMDLAMKRPQPQMFATESAKRGFTDECRNWINLGLHPNIVSCYYVREIGGVPAIFSEWMENGDLEHHIRNGTLYEGADGELQARLPDIAIQYARGLRYAHEHGLIHQDVKPANLLLTKDWQAKAADFGLAGARAQLTVREDETAPRDPGRTLLAAAGACTPAYCSPEQMEGKTLTRRTDIYSWAVSVMEMYLGSRPWENGVVAGAACREYMALPDGRVKIPDSLRDLLAQCMAIDPDGRPHDFAEVETRFREIYREVSGRDYPRPEPMAAPDTPESLNNMALTWLDLGMPEKAEACWEQALEKQPDHPAAVYNQGLYLWRQGRLRTENLLRRCGELAASARIPEQAALARRLLSQIEDEKRDTDPYMSFRCVFRQEGHPDPGDHGPNVCFSPDGETVYTSFDALSAYRADTGAKKYRRKEYLDELLTNDLKASPDGKHILFQKRVSMRPGAWQVPLNPDDSRRIWVAGAADGRVLRSLETTDEDLLDWCVHPDGIRCYLYDGHKVDLLDLNTGKRLDCFRLPGRTPDPARVAVSPDGRLLCCLGPIRYDRSALYLLDADTGRLLVREEPEEQLLQPRFSADGKTVYCLSDAGVTAFDTETRTYTVVLSIGRVGKLWTGTDGKRMLTDDDDCGIRLWDAETGRCLRAFQAAGTHITSLDAAPDLSRVAAADWNDHVQVWNLRTPVRSAPWEICRVMEYAAVISREQAEQEAREAIARTLETGDSGRALAQLRRAEEEFGGHRFFTLRRQITRCRTRAGLTGRYEISAFRPGSYWNKLDMAVFHPTDGTIAFHVPFHNAVRFFDENGRPAGETRLVRWEGIYPAMSGPRFSPDGKKLAIGGFRQVMLLDPKGEQEPRLWQGPAGKYTSLDFSPDGRLLAVAGSGKESVVLDVDSTEAVMLIPNPETRGRLTDIQFLPDGKHIAALSESSLQLIPVSAEGEIRPGLTIPLDAAYARFRRSPDGGTLLLFSAEPERKVSFLDLKTGKITGSFPLTRSGGGAVRYPGIFPLSVSPDGSVLATAGNETVTLRSLRDGRETESFAMPETVKQLAFSPDGCVLLAAVQEDVFTWAMQWELQ